MAYGFTSPGAAGANAIQEFLLQRAMQERQAMLDSLAVEKQRESEQQAQAELTLRQQQEQRVAEAQQQSQADMEKERQFRRASTIATTGVPGVIDPNTAGLLRNEGYGGLVTEGPVQQGSFLGNDANDIPQYDVVPGVLQFAGGSQYQNARVAEQARADAATQAQAAASERAAADRASREQTAAEANATREEIARMGAQNAGATRELQNELTRMRIDTEREKADAAKQTRTDQATGVANTRSQIRDLAQSLITDPELAGITGPIEGRRDTFLTGGAVDAKRRLDQLLGMLSLESRSKLKGQGTVSDFEGKMLERAVSAISRAAGPEITKQHLKEILDAFQGDKPQIGSAAPAGGSSFRVVGVR